MSHKSTIAERVFALYRLDQTVERAPELLDALRSAAAVAFGESGCVTSRVFLEAGEPGALLLIEEWDSVSHLERHVLSPGFQRLLAVLELSRSRPDVAYVLGGEVRGMEWLASRLQPQK